MKLPRFKYQLKGSAISGAAFLMATSAIGPGFLTQTAVFTTELMASMGFIILCSVIIDIIAQLNIWQVLSSQNQKASALSNDVLPGSGHVLTLLICFGGLAFNIGNISGAGLGMNMLLPVSVKTGSIISALIAMLIFMSADAKALMDHFVKLLGLLMIGMVLLVVFFAAPPLGEAALRTVFPEKVHFSAIVTLVGGTVGGYISFAGAHRLLESNVEALSPKQIRHQAIRAILLTAVMRTLLFLAVLGVVHKGFIPSSDNPAGSVFENALGYRGYQIFGIVLWSAAITSVVGAAYTSISFLQTLHPALQQRSRLLTILFIAISAVFFMFWGKPVKLLVMAGAINGFILPFSLALMLWVAMKKKTDIGMPAAWLVYCGWAVVALMLWMSMLTLWKELPQLF